MKLTKCYVSSFGKFKDFSFTFGSGLNTILADNGWGKSTLAYFIKAMFYGLSGSNKRSILENERQRFKPWNSTEKFGGSLEFLYKERPFKIERFFGNKESEDTLKLIDLESGKEVNSTNLGARIFQLDEEGFLSTAYLTQRDFEGVSTASITAKFNESAKPEDADQFNKAVYILEEQAKKFKAQRGNGGIINGIESEILENVKNLESAQSAEPFKRQFEKEIERLNLEKDRLSSEIKNLSNAINLKSKQEVVILKKKNYELALSERERLEGEQRNLALILNGKRVDDESISAATQSANELVRKVERRDTLIEVINSEKGKVQGKTFNPFYFFIIFSVILLGVSLAFFGLKNYIFGGVILAISTVFAVISFVVKRKKAFIKNLDNPLEKDLISLNAEITEIETALSKFLSQFNLIGESFLQKISALIDAEKQMRKVSNDLLNTCEKIKEHEKDLDLHSLQEQPILSVSESELDEKRKQYEKVLSLLSKNQEKLAGCDALLSEIPEYLSQDLRLKAELKEAKEKYKILEKTLKLLKEADERLKAKYRAPLEQSFNKFISLIENSEDFVADIDVDFKISVENKGFSRSKDYYSEGYKDLLEIAKRFALIDVFFSGEKPFVILDDPFCNLDEDKTERAVKLLEKLSESFQIIYFICHSSRGDKSAKKKA